MEYILLGSILLLLFILSKSKSAKKKKRKRHEVLSQPEDKIQQKGRIGEMVVQDILSRLGNEYIGFHDIMIQGNNGNTAQIDHIVFSPYGIFVIETKAYNGYIKGYEGAKNWVQFLKKQKRYEFYNPIKQNEQHIKALRTVLNDSASMLPIVSIIVFVGTKNIEVEATRAIVIRESELLTVIRNHVNEKLTMQQTYEMVDVLQKMNIISEAMREQHIKDIQKRGEQVENGICPSCGEALVERTGQYGVFLGCSGYPRCRFKTNMKEGREIIHL